MKKDFDRSKEFTKDLDYGHWGEGVMINFIESYFQNREKFVSYWCSNEHTNKAKLKEWDLKFGTYYYKDRINYTGQFEVEVKTDMYGVDTGNLIFEKSSNGKKSGVYATKARFFCYFLPLFKENNIYWIESAKLIELLKKYDTHLLQGGDIGSNTFMYRISRTEFDNDFKTAGGKIITYEDFDIPKRFEKNQFDSKKVVYESTDIKTYEDPFDFK